MTNKNSYEDIINLPNHRSKKHPPQSMESRAAQFSPFKALTGYEDSTEEAARLVDEKVQLTDEEHEKIRQALTELREHAAEHPEVTLSCFVPDLLKDGGSYTVYTGTLKKVDEIQQVLVFTDGNNVKFDNIIAINKEA